MFGSTNNLVCSENGRTCFTLFLYKSRKIKYYCFQMLELESVPLGLAMGRDGMRFTNHNLVPYMQKR